MKDGKFETQAEIWRHLLEGKKIQYKDGEIVFLKDDSVTTLNKEMKKEVHKWLFCYPSEWSIYEEPKPKKKVTLYRYTYKYGIATHQTNFTSENWSSIEGAKDILLLTESKEIEVDDV